MRSNTIFLVSVIACLLPKFSLCANYGGNTQSQNGYGSTQYQGTQWSGKTNTDYDTHLLENHYNQLYQQQFYQGNAQQYPQSQYQSGFTGYGKTGSQKGVYNSGYSGSSYPASYGKTYSGYGKQTPYQGQDVAVVVPPSAGFSGNPGWADSGFGYNAGFGYGLPSAGFGYGNSIPQYGYGPLGSPISPYLFQGPSLMDHAMGFLKTDTGKLVGAAALGTILYKTLG
ncbi:shematrin-like protein 1 [Magallana gigas]|uniref:shematrin-like protein 1 n=1 Tax=Magallana gigas TaxID=29159 RepID=UPI00333FD396